MKCCIDNDNDGYSLTGGSCGVVDCNDNINTVHPGANEICGDGIDQDCDGADLTCSVICTDFDNGLDYYTKSQTSGPLYSGGSKEIFYDVCDTSDSTYLKEGYCDSEGILKYASYQCPNGCQDGACSQQIECTDIDGDGYSISGGNCGTVDCNDNNPTIKPGAAETCGDVIDQDCDGADLSCLILNLKFDEGSGTTAVDSSGNNNNGKIYGAAYSTGVSNTALNFDGINDYVEINYADSLSLGTAITLTAWVKDSAKTTAGPRQIISKLNEYLLRWDNATDIACFINIDGNWEPRLSVISPISKDTWHYVACTWDHSTGDLRLYVDGALNNQMSGRKGTVTKLTTPLRIGSWDGVLGFWNGGIDEVKIYNKALTEQEILDEYNNFKPCTDSDGDGYSIKGGVCGAVDCNDNDANIKPGATEVKCDGIDQDCSGSDNAGTDADSDGYKIDGGLCGAIDCNDNNANINPSKPEACGNNIDDNCNNQIDEGCTSNIELCNNLDDNGNGQIDENILCNPSEILQNLLIEVITNKQSYSVGEEVGLR